MSILVTGSSGMIGTRLCQRLEEQGIEYCGFDQFPNRWDLQTEQRTIKGDLLQPVSLQKITDPVEVIIHLAARARVTTSIDNPYEGIENVLSTFNVLEFARQRGIKKIIFASSKEVYGSLSKIPVIEERVNPSSSENPYSASKLAGESFIAAYRKCYELDSVLLRFSNVYGMYDTSLRFIPLVIQKTFKQEPLTLYGKEKKLDFVFIDDIVTGIMLALQKFDQVKNDVYNLGYGKGIALLEVAKIAQKIMKQKVRVSVAPNRKGEIMEYVADITKAKNALGYEPKYTIESGLQKTIEWYHAIKQ